MQPWPRKTRAACASAACLLQRSQGRPRAWPPHRRWLRQLRQRPLRSTPSSTAPRRQRSAPSGPRRRSAAWPRRASPSARRRAGGQPRGQKPTRTKGAKERQRNRRGRRRRRSHHCRRRLDRLPRRGVARGATPPRAPGRRWRRSPEPFSPAPERDDRRDDDDDDDGRGSFCPSSSLLRRRRHCRPRRPRPSGASSRPGPPSSPRRCSRRAPSGEEQDASRGKGRRQARPRGCGLAFPGAKAEK